ncbi:hypothetical protein [Streptomyces scabiei]|nr:hypothetical protein [Streptomyces scabiei]
MAHFVLNKPDDIEIVSFFITGRLAGQDDRTAFCEVVQRQFCAILGEEVPPSTEHTRDEQLLDAFERAAYICQSQGRRLILVVDGLDEDRGVVAGPDSYSIAGLLPIIPPHGSKIIVSGRPHPPIPDDVPGDHPLHDPTVSRTLNVSPHAEALRRDAERDLFRLLDADGLGRFLVGLTAVAGGGLTATDLAHLADAPPRLVQVTLATVAGRSFRLSGPHWPDENESSDLPETYLLAHEELQQAAMQLLSTREIKAHQDRLHGWADSYRMRSWPEDTPQYLLRGYSRLLQATEDTVRLTNLACDVRRHERLQHASGTDLEALSEISAAFDLALADSPPSEITLEGAISLAVRRDSLHERLKGTPNSVFSTWIELGRASRAVSYARAQVDPSYRALSLMYVAEKVLQSGCADYARELRDEAIAVAHTIIEADLRAETFAELSVDLALIGQYEISAALVDIALDAVGGVDGIDVPSDAATALSRSLSEMGEYRRALEIIPWDAKSRDQVSILQPVVECQARTDKLGQALDLVGSLEDLTDRSGLLLRISGTLAQDNNHVAAAGVLEKVIPLIAEVSDCARRSHLFSEAANLWANVGDKEHAVQAANEAVLSASEIRGDIRSTDFALAIACEALAGAGNHADAVEKVGLISDESMQHYCLSLIASCHAVSGDYENAMAVIDLIGGSQQRGYATERVAVSMARSGDHEQAILLVNSLPVPAGRSSRQIEALCAIAVALFRAGEHDRALEMARRATSFAHAGTDRETQLYQLCQVADALSGVGELDLARDLANEVLVGGGNEKRSLAPHIVDSVSRVLAKVGDFDRAIDVVRGIGYFSTRSNALISVADVLTSQEQLRRAWEILEEMIPLCDEYNDSRMRMSILAAVAEIASKVGDAGYAASLIQEVIDSARAEELQEDEAFGLVCAAETFLQLGDRDKAIHLALEASALDREFSQVDRKEEIWEFAARSLAHAGRYEDALRLALEIEELEVRAELMLFIIRCAAQSGEVDSAISLAGEIVHPHLKSLAWVAVCAARGDVPGACFNLLQALRTGTWREAVSLMGDAGSKYLVSLANLLLRDFRQT